MNRHLQDACLELKDRSARLTMLNLSGRGIGSSGMKRLADSCCFPRPEKVVWRQGRPYLTPLVCLWLENNYLHPHSAEDLARLIRVSPSLRHLHLAHNALSNEGARAVADACFSQVQVCNLADNEIGPAGARNLAEQLKDPTCTIQTLVLDGNRLRDEGAMEFVDALRHNTSLKSLDLRYNDITQRGLQALRDVLKSGENMTLQELDLEEEQDEDCNPIIPFSCRPAQKKQQCSPRTCTCVRCQMKSEIDFYLALNRAGRHSFANLDLSSALWSRILAKTSRKSNPSLVHAALCERPDIAMMP